MKNDITNCLNGEKTEIPNASKLVNKFAKSKDCEKNNTSIKYDS